MRLAQRFRRTLPEPGGWPAGVVLSQTYGARDTEPIQGTFAAYAAEGYASNGIVFTIILARLQLFAEASFKWRNLADKRLFGTEDLAILENPWPGGTTGELLARMEQDASLAGNAFIRREADRLVRLRPDLVDIIRTDHQGFPEVIGYAYWGDGRGSEATDVFEVDEVAHWSPIPDPLADFRGMSWLTPVVREINADRSMTGYQGDYFANNATPNALIKYAQKLGPGAVEKIQSQWQARYGGMEGWKTAVLDQGADFQVIGNSFDQMEFTNLQAANENRIAAAGGVPAIVAGLKEGMSSATYANYEAAMRRFADMTMRPNWRSACASLSKLVTVPAGAELWYDTTDISALREGEKQRADTMQVLASAASTLLMAGYEPGSITAALTASDLSLLAHTGLLSVQLQKPGEHPDAAQDSEDDTEDDAPDDIDTEATP